MADSKRDDGRRDAARADAEGGKDADLVENKPKTQIVSAVSDWRIDRTAGRQYGVCWVEFSDPLKELSFKRGFPLTNPTHARCAAFSLLMTLEIVLSQPQCEPFFVVIVIRSSDLYEMLLGARSAKFRNWVASDGRTKPDSVNGFKKGFWLGILSKIDWIIENKRGDLSYQHMEDGDNAFGKHFVDLDVDIIAKIQEEEDRRAEAKRKKTKTPAKEEEEKQDEQQKANQATQQPKELDPETKARAFAAETQKRNVIRQELKEAYGARGTRRARKLSRKERGQMLEKDEERWSKIAERERQKEEEVRRKVSEYDGARADSATAAIAAARAKAAPQGPDAVGATADTGSPAVAAAGSSGEPGAQGGAGADVAPAAATERAQGPAGPDATPTADE
jgi:hypothetical protein